MIDTNIPVKRKRGRPPKVRNMERFNPETKKPEADEGTGLTTGYLPVTDVDVVEALQELDGFREFERERRYENNYN